MESRIASLYGTAVMWLERILALAVLLGVVVAAVQSILVLGRADWSSSDTFYELLYRALLLVIGLELVRMLVTHKLSAVLELLAFVIARKMLKPNLTAEDVTLAVISFVILLVGRRYFLDSKTRENDACR